MSWDKGFGDPDIVRLSNQSNELNVAAQQELRPPIPNPNGKTDTDASLRNQPARKLIARRNDGRTNVGSSYSGRQSLLIKRISSIKRTDSRMT